MEVSRENARVYTGFVCPEKTFMYLPIPISHKTTSLSTPFDGIQLLLLNMSIGVFFLVILCTEEKRSTHLQLLNTFRRVKGRGPGQEPYGSRIF